MKKLLLLMLVLLGGVMQVSATNYLFIKASPSCNWWTSSGAKFYINSTELSTVSAYGTYYYYAFDTDQTIQVERKNPDNLSQTWNKTVSISLTAGSDKFIDILNTTTDNDQNVSEINTNLWEHVYLNDDWNSWGNNSGRSHEFTGAGHNFTIDLNNDELLKLRTDDYHFRFYVGGTNGTGNWAPKTDNDVISTTDYANCENKNDGSFKIPQTSHAKSARISLSYNNSTDNTWKWHVTATITTYSGRTIVGYMNVSGKTEIDPNNVYAYAWDNNGLLILGAWPGTKMTANSDGTYSLSDVDFVANNMTIIFNNGRTEDQGNQVKTGNLAFEDNKVYDFTGTIGNQTIGISSYGCNTYSSAYPLEFPEGDGDDVLKAYIITGIGENHQLTDTRVYKVPAGTGLFITGTVSKSDYSVPVSPKTKDNVSENMMVVGTGDAVSATSGDYTNYILTNKTTTNANAPLKFYKANNNTVPVGKAYLQIPTSNVGARDFFWFDNETTGIDKVDVNANNNFDAAPIFNLAGQRVNKSYKGVVIVNGKKMLNK